KFLDCGTKCNQSIPLYRRYRLGAGRPPLTRAALDSRLPCVGPARVRRGSGSFPADRLANAALRWSCGHKRVGSPTAVSETEHKVEAGHESSWRLPWVGPVPVAFPEKPSSLPPIPVYHQVQSKETLQLLFWAGALLRRTVILTTRGALSMR